FGPGLGGISWGPVLPQRPGEARDTIDRPGPDCPRAWSVLPAAARNGLFPGARVAGCRQAEHRDVVGPGIAKPPDDDPRWRHRSNVGDGRLLRARADVGRSMA